MKKTTKQLRQLARYEEISRHVVLAFEYLKGNVNIRISA
jgi:hypothetical protein